MLRKFLSFAAVGLALLLLLTGGTLLVQEIARSPSDEKKDCLIILGCAVRGDTPSPMLERRLQKGLELYQQGAAPVIIVCGGKGKGENITEAEAMRKYLTKGGVPDRNILPEDESTNTWQNLVNAREIMRENGLQTALIVTSEFHVPRSLSYARELGIKASGAGAHTWWHLRLYYSLREIASNVKHLITHA